MVGVSQKGPQYLILGFGYTTMREAVHITELVQNRGKCKTLYIWCHCGGFFCGVCKCLDLLIYLLKYAVSLSRTCQERGRRV